MEETKNKTIGYCVRCKKKQEMKDSEIWNVGSKRMARGLCSVCDCKMCVMLGKEAKNENKS